MQSLRLETLRATILSIGAYNLSISLPFAMVPGVSFRTLRAHIPTINIGGIVKLTTRAKIVGFDG